MGLQLCGSCQPLGGPPRPLIGHTQIPSNANGLALSQDESTLYVSCSSLTGMDPNSEAAVNQLFAFDLVEVEGGLLCHRAAPVC